MNASELMKKIAESGSDGNGIEDRFGDNAELFKMCFDEFLDDRNFESLGKSISANDFRSAFEAAHALKGLSGNLGLTDFYSAICILVESLRSGITDSIADEYAEVIRLYGLLKDLANVKAPDNTKPSITKLADTDDLCVDTNAADAMSAEKTAPENSKKKNTEAHSSVGTETERKKKKNLIFVSVSALIILAVMSIVGYTFYWVRINFRKDVTTESSQHIAEMSNQIGMYIGDHIANDWKIAESVCDSILSSYYSDDDTAVRDMLRGKQEVWGVTNLMLYTESGYCIYTDGGTEKNDLASETIDRARRNGKCMTIIDSHITYTLPLETDLKFKGSPIAAISVVRDMKTFLDDMNLSSFDGNAQIYLTDENGIIISMLTKNAATQVFNFKTLIKSSELVPLGKNLSADDILSSPDTVVFLMTVGGMTNYTASTLVPTLTNPLRLFYLVPDDIVNSATNGFSNRLTAFSLGIIIIFAIMVSLIFLSLYRSRKMMFDREIMTRNRMLDLLIKTTRTSFVLFKVNQSKPTFISSNSSNIIGDKFWTLNKSDEGFFMRNSTDTENTMIRQTNKMLKGWDGKTPFRSGYIITGNANLPYCFEIQLYPISDDGNDYVGIAQDMTSTYEREEATKTAMEMATAANEAKSRFLSNMSHDIRTPMNAIMNMTNFALESIDDPKKIGGYLRTIRESSVHLLHIINDVLDMSRIESGRTVVSSAPFDMNAEMLKLLGIIKPLCTANNLTLITDIGDISSVSVCGDALKLSQIIMNLLSNAVKFTPEKGAIRFSAKRIPSLSDDIVDIRFSVEDNGIGISEENMKHIFDPFCRANDKKVGNIEGTGLGLSICKSFVEAMGGTIRCESEEGEGSIFTVELFFKKADAEADAETHAVSDFSGTPFLGMHCLVAEDNPANRIIANELLKRMGFIVDFADNGAKCLQNFTNSKPGTYDIIYMDIQMPVMDGFNATAAIRSCSHPQAKTIPIVAMTASVFAEDIEKARVAGMDAFVGKPIVTFELFEQTKKALNTKK